MNKKQLAVAIFTFGLSLFNFHSAVAQNGINSPYSRYGFGMMADRATGFNKAMGGVAQGFRDGQQINVGNPASNQTLSEQRAKAVYDYLVNHGIEASRLSYKGYGQTQPVSDNSSPEGRRQNRRTVFTIIAK